MSSPTELPSVLVLAGSVVDERPFGPGGRETRRGTHLFRPSAKVYLSSLRNAWSVLREDPLERIQVVGQHRASREWTECWVAREWIANWRIQVLCQPGALRRLAEADWPGFWLREGDYGIGEDRSSPEAIGRFLEALGKRYQAEYWTRERARRQAPGR